VFCFVKAKELGLHVSEVPAENLALSLQLVLFEAE